MPAWVVSLLVAIGATAWIYNTLARSNGNANPQSNLITAAIAGGIVYFVLYTLLNWVLNFDSGL